MEKIKIEEQDGSSPIPICRARREWVVSRYQLIEMIALRFLSNDVPVAEGDRNADLKAIEHIRKCPKCRAWFHRVTPEVVLHRQSRLTQYCCAGMFVAVEESDGKKEILVTFEMFRGEDPCWMINGIRTFASYCPWCGTKLPEKPFIEEK